MSGLVQSFSGQRPGSRKALSVVALVAIVAWGAGCREPRELFLPVDAGTDEGELTPGGDAEGNVADAEMLDDTIGSGGGGPTGSGGHGTGGVGTGPGSGGAGAGNGGARGGTGGAPSGSGGALPGSGGIKVGSGGVSGSGGIKVGSGGVSGSGGIKVSSGGVNGSGGTKAMTASGGAPGSGVDAGADLPMTCTGTLRLCNGKCLAASACCADADCPAQGGSGAAGKCNMSTAMCEYPPAHTTLYTFDANIEPWTLYMTSPTRLADKTHLSHDAHGGESNSGALKVEAPFDAPNQKVEFQDMQASPLALGGRTIRARVRLVSGLSDDPAHPGAIKLFAKSGTSFDYASGAWTNLVGTGWNDVTLIADQPDLVQGPFSPGEVRQIGFELRVFNETERPVAATIVVDSIGY